MTPKNLLTGLLPCAILGTVLLQPGCKDKPQPTGPRIKARQTQYPLVPIHVWRIQAGGDVVDPLTPSTTNRGCRLSSRQITDYILDLDKFCQTSLHVELAYYVTGPPDDVQVIPMTVEDIYIPSGDDRTVSSYTWVIYSLRKISEYMRDDGSPLLDTRVVNIFFVGNVQVQPHENSDAFSLDPAAQDTQGMTNHYRRHIAINDGAYHLSGPGVYNPEVPVLQHEFIHYLIRQCGTCNQQEADGHLCTLGETHPQNGRYSWGEHAADPQNIMAPGAEHWSVAELDKKEIEAKSGQGEGWWNVP